MKAFIDCWLCALLFATLIFHASTHNFLGLLFSGVGLVLLFCTSNLSRSR